MKKFFSDEKIGAGEDLFPSLLSLVDSNLVLDRNQVLKDVALHESLKDGSVSYGDVRVHTAKTGGIADFCLSCAQVTDGHVEILILWNEISEHILSKLSEISKFLENSVKQNFSCEHIIYALKKS